MISRKFKYSNDMERRLFNAIKDRYDLDFVEVLNRFQILFDSSDPIILFMYRKKEYYELIGSVKVMENGYELTGYTEESFRLIKDNLYDILLELLAR